MKFVTHLCLGLALLLAAAACSGPTGRLKGPEEGDLVDVRKAGIEVYNQLISDALPRLLDARGVERGMKIAFVEIENATQEEMGANREAVYEIVDTMIVNSRVFTNVSRRLVDVAMAETGLRNPASLLLQEPRDRFVTVLRSSNAEPKYLLWGKMTTVTSDGNDMRQRDYQLTLDLVDAITGETITKQTARVRKEYTE